MNLKHLFLISISLVWLNQSSQAQLLKKIKDKVNKTINSDSGSEKKEENKTSSENTTTNSSSGSSSNEEKNPAWCDGLDASGGGSGAGGTFVKDGVEYKKIYSNPNGFRILYDESSFGIKSDSKGHRIVLNERVNNKNQFKLIENGKVIATGSEVDPAWLANNGSQTTISEDKAQGTMSKYIVGDTVKHNIPKSDAKTVTIQKTDDDQLEMALNIARQSDEYKKMSDAEKKEFEETVRAGIAKNNSMAGTTYDIPAQQGGQVAMVNGYFLVVKGKKLGKFSMPPAVVVSPDETKVFAVGVNDQSKPVMIVNGKTTPLDANKYSAVNGRIISSPDGNKHVYLEQKKMSEQELQALTNSASSGKRSKLQYNVIRSDGTALMVSDYTYSGKFQLTNSGALIIINEETGEVHADDKSIGKFTLQNGDRVNPDAVLIGSDISKIAYYNGNDGSLTYLDGTVKKLGIVYPRIVSSGGKSSLSWFRKCGNDIYTATFAY